MERYETASERVDLFIESSGSGPPVVLVHGSWGDHHNWDAAVPLLARTFRMTTYDRRGHSASSRWWWDVS
jgi:pimeloyl-ACP methyl ester carboxylesterase